MDPEVRKKWLHGPCHVAPDQRLRGRDRRAGVGWLLGTAGFTSNGHAYEFRRRRVVELEHGRVAMLACMGYITLEYFKFSVYLAPSIGLRFAIAALTKVPGVGGF
eukprot:8165997-Heterocapsa_arctica.AAC.1